LEPFTFDYYIGFDKEITSTVHKLESGSEIWDLQFPMDVRQAEKDTLHNIMDNFKKIQEGIANQQLDQENKKAFVDLYAAFKSEWKLMEKRMEG
jgi:benzoyl-CoA reductase/2-hydroxyglutaryl-CoA dehydratase subunit BcrC/BadD/HgdB